MIWKKRSKQKWIDVVDPTQAEIKKIQEIFTLDPDALNHYFNGSKKPEIILLDNNQKFTILIDLFYKDIEILEKEGLYIFQGDDWLITIHSSKIQLSENISSLLKHKNPIIQSASINLLI